MRNSETIQKEIGELALKVESLTKVLSKPGSKEELGVDVYCLLEKEQYNADKTFSRLKEELEEVGEKSERYTVAVEAAETRGPEGPVELEDFDSLEKALKAIENFSNKYYIGEEGGLYIISITNQF